MCLKRLIQLLRGSRVLPSTQSIIGRDPALPAGATRKIINIDEPGKNLLTQIYSTDNTVEFKIMADNIELKFGLFKWVYTGLLNGWGYQNNTPGISLLEVNPPPGDNMFLIHYGYKWKHSLTIEARNPSPAPKWAIATVTFETPDSEGLSVQEPEGLKDPPM